MCARGIREESRCNRTTARDGWQQRVTRQLYSVNCSHKSSSQCALSMSSITLMSSLLAAIKPHRLRYGTYGPKK